MCTAHALFGRRTHFCAQCMYCAPSVVGWLTLREGLHALLMHAWPWPLSGAAGCSVARAGPVPVWLCAWWPYGHGRQAKPAKLRTHLHVCGAFARLGPTPLCLPCCSAGDGGTAWAAGLTATRSCRRCWPRSCAGARGSRWATTPKASTKASTKQRCAALRGSRAWSRACNPLDSLQKRPSAAFAHAQRLPQRLCGGCHPCLRCGDGGAQELAACIYCMVCKCVYMWLEPCSTLTLGLRIRTACY